MKVLEIQQFMNCMVRITMAMLKQNLKEEKDFERDLFKI